MLLPYAEPVGAMQNHETDSLLKKIESLEVETAALRRERDHLSASLQDSETELAAIYQNAPMLMLLVDADRQVRKVNRAAAHLVGRSEAEMIGRRGGDSLRCINALYDEKGCGFGPHCQQCIVRRCIMDCLDTGKGCHGVEASLPLLVDDQQVEMFFLLFTARLQVRNESMVLVTIVDIHERRQAEEALRESEGRFRQLFANVPVPYQSLDETGTLIEVNPAWLKTLGYDRSEVIGRNFKDFLPVEGHDHFTASFPVFKALGEVSDIEFELLKKDCGRILAAFTGKIGYDADGRVAQTHCVFQDITTQRKRDNDLRRLAEAVRKTSDGVVVAEIDGTITYANPAFEEITGYPLEEIMGQNPRFLKSGLQDEAFYRDLWRTVLSGRRWRGRMVNRRKDGRRYTADCSITPVSDAEGRLVNFVWLTRDITELLKTEERLNQAQKMEAMGTLASGIAHDFNNLLFPLVGFAEMLKDDLPVGSPLQDHVDEILHAAIRSRELVKQILAFSRKADHRARPIRIQPIVREAVKLMRAAIPKTITMHQYIDPDTPPVVADPTQIHQIILNLATNAFHAMEQGNGTLEITLSGTDIAGENKPLVGIQPGRYVSLRVADTGIGMTPEVLDKALDPYFTTKEEGKGTGLGLSVVHGIVRSHDGEIAIQSEPGKGTVCTVYLPALEGFDEEILSNEKGPVPGGTESILLVDDEEAIVRMVGSMLTRLGYRVTSCTSSIEAMEKFKTEPGRFDLLFTDMTMPGMTGIKLAREVKKAMPHLPVIICTGYSEKLDEAGCKALGMEGYIMKPVTTREVAATVRRVLDERKMKGR